MKKHLLITSALVFGMGIAGAQIQSSPAPAPMQSGTGEPVRGAQQQSVPPAAAQAPGTPVTNETAAQSFKGCLSGSPGSWSLASDNGRNLVLSGTDDQISPYKGQEVRIQGVQASDGTVKIDSINQISASCANQASSNMGGQTSSAEQNNASSQTSTATSNSTSQSTTATQPPSSMPETNNQSSAASSTQPPATASESTGMNGQSSTATGAASTATTPPVTNQTPANSVGSGTEPSATQNPSAGNAAANSGQSNTTADQNPDQGVKHYSDMDQNAGQKLPQTASPLPLLGLLGLGSLAGGLISRRKK